MIRKLLLALLVLTGMEHKQAMAETIYFTGPNISLQKTVDADDPAAISQALQNGAGGDDHAPANLPPPTGPDPFPHT
ncbi:MAG: hypothetical protein B7Z78_12685 [Rhodospirillales bacterium 20-60-12]|nr:MAG: hypothetical protein B7Z78_12685 [Rhodospirillales bacterium 20-60-12]